MKHYTRDSLSIYLPWVERRGGESMAEFKVRTRQKGHIATMDALSNASFPVDDSIGLKILFVHPKGGRDHPEKMLSDIRPAIEGIGQALGIKSSNIDSYSIKFQPDARGVGMIVIKAVR